MAKQKEKVTEIIEECCNEFCNDYCKWPSMYIPEENDGIELCDSDICAECPINKLM